MSQPPPRRLRASQFILIGSLLAYSIVSFVFTQVINTKENYSKFLVSIAIDSRDNIYISDSGNSTINKYDPQGNLLATLGSEGSGNGQLSRLSGQNKIAISSNDELYAIDNGNYRVQKFDYYGFFLAKWGSRGNEPGQFTSPQNIAVDSQGQVYVRDNKVIKKFDANGNFLGTLGEGLPEQAQLISGESNLAVNSVGEVYTYGQVRGKIFRFDANGQPLQGLTILNLDMEHFNNFDYMTLDRQDNIYFMDLSNDLIIKLDQNGKYVSRWTFNDKAHLMQPYEGIAFDSRNKFYLLNRDAEQVEIFDSSGHSLKQFSIGMPKWVRDGFFPVTMLFFLLLPLVFAIYELRHKRLHNLPMSSTTKSIDPILALNVLGMLSQFSTLFTSCIGLLLSLSLAAGSSVTVPAPFISFYFEQSVIAVGWLVILSCIVSLVMVPFVRKKPLVAGFVQVVAASIIFFATLNQTLKIIAIAMAIGGILAIISAFKRNKKSPQV